MAAMIRQDEDGEGFHYATNYEFPPDWQEFCSDRPHRVARALSGSHYWNAL